MQHGEALAEEAAPGRPLSLTGRDQVRSVGRQAAHAEVKLESIHHSEKLRARQSAEILSDELAVETFERAGLGPQDDVNAVAEWIEGQGSDVALVGHLPFLDRLTSRLVLGQPTPGVVAFQFGALVRLVRGEKGWKVDWILRP